jgi:hypothetical protein
MRSDMDKVIVERPRPGSSRHVARRFRRLDPRRIEVSEDADDLFPTRIGHRRAAALGRGRKWLNENLAPLRRYLESQAGRPWNDVWSEICANISVDNTVQKHVRDHVKDFVAVNTSIHDGTIMTVSRYGGPQPLSGTHWMRLYVDPQTGILHRIPSKLSWRAERKCAAARDEAEVSLRMRILAPDRQLHLLDDGNWWEVTLARAGDLHRAASPHEIVDVVDRTGLSSLPREERYRRWGLCAIAKRPLSRREIKALRLRST